MSPQTTEKRYREIGGFCKPGLRVSSFARKFAGINTNERRRAKTRFVSLLATRSLTVRLWSFAFSRIFEQKRECSQSMFSTKKFACNVCLNHLKCTWQIFFICLIKFPQCTDKNSITNISIAIFLAGVFRPANSHGSAVVSRFFVISHRLTTRLQISQFFWKKSFWNEIINNYSLKSR